MSDTQALLERHLPGIARNIRKHKEWNDSWADVIDETITTIRELQSQIIQYEETIYQTIDKAKYVRPKSASTAYIVELLKEVSQQQESSSE